MFLEIACFNLESACIALAAGAHRIELCAARETGGVTPSLHTLTQLRAHMAQCNQRTPLYAMVRPRGGDFCYSGSELQQMRHSLVEMKPLVDGFVFGILTDTVDVDGDANQELVELAKPLPCTFHRAFDTLLPVRGLPALEAVLKCGFSSVLTSGGERTAMAGKATIARLIEQGMGQADIVVGGGVRAGDLHTLSHATGARWFHSSAITTKDGGLADESEVRSLINQLAQLSAQQTRPD